MLSELLLSSLNTSLGICIRQIFYLNAKEPNVDALFFPVFTIKRTKRL